MSNKVLLLGLDGLELNLLKRYSKIDFSKLAYGGLKSTIPPVTIPAWISLGTGRSPGSLGLVDFFKINKAYKRVRYDLLETFGKLHLFYFSNKKLAMNRFYKFGKDFAKLSDKIDIYKEEFEPPWEKLTGKGVIDTDIKNMNRGIEKLNKLIESEYDLVFYFLNLPDFGIHFGTEKEMKQIYEEIGKFLNKIMDKCDENDWNMMVVSDHGAKKINKRFNLNTWLKENNYLELKNENTRKLNFINWLSEKNMKLVRILMRIKSEIDKHFKGEEDRIKEKMILNNVRWENTKVFAVSTAITNFIPLYINLENKYEKGCVSRKEYENLRNELKKKLLSIKNPETGKRVIEKVWFKEEIYKGDNMDTMPDLVVKSKDNYLIGHRPFPSIFSKRNRYIHGLYGTLIGYGSDFRSGVKLDKAEIIDVTPTLLHLMGCSVPKDINGKVLKDIFKEDSEPDKRKIKFSSPIGEKEVKGKKLSKDEEEKISQRLKDLGYLE